MKKVNLIPSSKRMLALAAIATGVALPPQVMMAAQVAQVVQQAGSVKGQVLDTTGEPVIGATVRVKGSKTGTVTDIDGKFTLNANAGSTIEISYIGYKTVTAKAGSSPLSIKMEEDGQTLNDVVVVGYGTMRKKDLTGSVVQIDAKKLADQNPGSVQDLLRGTSWSSDWFRFICQGCRCIYPVAWSELTLYRRQSQLTIDYSRWYAVCR